MKLSIALIAAEIDSKIISGNYQGMENNMNLSGCVFYRGETCLKSHSIYLMHHSQVMEELNIEKEAAIICLGKVPDAYIGISAVYMELEENQDIFVVSNQIGAVFEKYSNWQEALSHSLKEKNLQRMIEASYLIFENEITVIDEDYNFLAQTLGRQGENTKAVPLDIVHLFKNDKLFNDVRLLKDVFYYPAGILNYDSLCRNVFLMEEYFCRITVAIRHRPWRCHESILLEYLGSYVDNYVEQNFLKGTQSEGTGLIKAFHCLLNGKSVSQGELKHLLVKKSWYVNQNYLMGCLLLSKGDFHNKTGSYYCRQIMRAHKEVYAIEKDDNIALIINVSYYENSHKHFMSEFIYTLREGNFRIGFSNTFTDVSLLKYYYRQAEIAVALGLESNDMIWSHHFSEHVLEYLLKEAAGQMPVQLLCAPELLILKEYDLHNQTEYYHTLKLYLGNRMNAVQTAKKLFIHPATMAYRLKRLKELTQLDFTAADKVLYLHISYKMLENV